MTPIEALADSVLDGVKTYVEKKIGPMAAKIAELEAQLAAVPAPQIIDPIALAKEVTAACLEAIPAPKDGSDGAPGRDAEPVDMDALARLINEAVGGAMAAVKLPADGKDGEDGKDGIAGQDGKSVEPADLTPIVTMAVAEAVAILPPAKDGADGQDGQDGEPGPAGRDAAHLDILPEIDPGKKYASGTWAKYAGGLFKAFRSTDLLDVPENSGWECMVEGLAGLTAKYDGERGVEVSSIYSSGAVQKQQWHLPIPIYRQVHKHGEKYEQCDNVTSDGSQWFALKDTDAIPGASPDWRLAVKRGRDGKDGEMKIEGKAEQVRLK